MTLPTTNYIALHNGLYWVFANGRPVRIADAWEVARHKKETGPAQSSPPINVVVYPYRPVGDMTAPWSRLQGELNE